MTVKTVGLDLAKDVFQVHGISENGRVIFNKAIKRAKLLSFFEKLPPVQGRYGGVWIVPSLGPPAAQTWARREVNACRLRQTLREAREERCR